MDTFGEKVYRLSLNAGMSCPNRDGTLGLGGCAFCSEGGSGDFAPEASLSIPWQIEEAQKRIAGKTNCHKFIAYFQSFTNTYAPIEQLRPLYEAALAPEEIVTLSIGTRSDCLPADVLALLQELNQAKPVWVELGLQSVHNKTLQQMNTHTTVEQFDQAVYALHQAGIPVIAHVILGFPGETREMMLETIRHLAGLPIFGVKLQLLHVLSGTALAKQYAKDPFPLPGLEDYCELVIDCLELLPPQVVIHRLTGDGPRNLLIAPKWSTDKKRVLNRIRHRLKERDTRQGALYHGRAIYNL